MKEAIIIQARIGKDSRLPYKVLLPLAGRPAIYRMLDNFKGYCYPVIVAIPKNDLILEEVIRAYPDSTNVHIFKGDENNVCKRVLDAAEYYEVETIIDLTADCPTLNYEVVKPVLTAFRNHKLTDYHYCSNVFPQRFIPDGWDVQVYSRGLLEATYERIKNKKHFSHVGWNVYDKYKDSVDKFKIESIKPNWIFTLDTIEDWQFLDSFYQLVHDVPNHSPQFFIDRVETDSNLMQLQKACQKIRRKVAGEG